LRIKHKQACDLFQRIGGIDPARVDPVIPCPEPYGYRNRIMIRSQWDKFKQGLNIGFLRADNRLVVDIEECKIAEPALNEQIRRCASNRRPKGDQSGVAGAPKAGRCRGTRFSRTTFSFCPSWWKPSARLRDSGSRFLLDAYCGVGFFSIELGGLVEEFAGVEVDTAAIQAARRNARRGAEQRAIPGRTGGRAFAADVGAVRGPLHHGDFGPAAHGLSAGNAASPAEDGSAAGSLRFLPPGHAGARLERFVRGECL
jgi:hypothetical protein